MALLVGTLTTPKIGGERLVRDEHVAKLFAAIGRTSIPVHWIAVVALFLGQINLPVPATRTACGGRRRRWLSRPC